mmetsp:Transcript_57177/g.185811  ORF Transcript_57177/g.185811 Transcript_57177/m.185811 type:complete len:267 (-) Transcript_57177:257-1057(-)
MLAEQPHHLQAVNRRRHTLLADLAHGPPVYLLHHSTQQGIRVAQEGQSARQLVQPPVRLPLPFAQRVLRYGTPVHFQREIDAVACQHPLPQRLNGQSFADTFRNWSCQLRGQQVGCACENLFVENSESGQREESKRKIAIVVSQSVKAAGARPALQQLGTRCIRDREHRGHVTAWQLLVAERKVLVRVPEAQQDPGDAPRHQRRHRLTARGEQQPKGRVAMQLALPSVMCLPMLQIVPSPSSADRAAEVKESSHVIFRLQTLRFAP